MLTIVATLCTKAEPVLQLPNFKSTLGFSPLLSSILLSLTGLIQITYRRYNLSFLDSFSDWKRTVFVISCRNSCSSYLQETLCSTSAISWTKLAPMVGIVSFFFLNQSFIILNRPSSLYTSLYIGNFFHSYIFVLNFWLYLLHLKH